VPVSGMATSMRLARPSAMRLSAMRSA
jgi:hypothetical protein